MYMPPLIILPTVKEEIKAVGPVEIPVVTVTIDPTEPNVGDKITVSVNVKRADGITPIEGMKVDFFVEDSEGWQILGDRMTTDAGGNATASWDYYVGMPEAGKDLKFVVVTRAKIVP
jgi:hypothetical protein